MDRFGPWDLDEGDLRTVYDLETSNIIAEVDADAGEAAGRIIAAAPELLEALKAMDGYYAKRWIGGPDDFTEEQRSWLDEDFLIAWRSARAAIAKAEGRSNDNQADVG